VVEEPNAIVIHHMHGLEALHLYSGRTLCSMALDEQSHSLYLDATGDGLVDAFQVVTPYTYNAETGDVNPRSYGLSDDTCEAMSRIGVPAMYSKRQFPICQGASKAGLFQANQVPYLDVELRHMSSVWPVPLDSSGVSRVGVDTDIVYLTSNGVLSSWRSSSGGLVWRRATRAHWNHEKSSATAARRVQFTACLVAGHEAVLAVGDEYASIVDSTGRLSVDWPLHGAQVIARPVFVDLDGDHHSEIVLSAHSAVLVFAIDEAHAGSLVVPVMILFAILGIALAAWGVSALTATSDKAK
jgi:hypothetical protein